MTRTPELIGPAYDAPARLPSHTYNYQPKKQLVLAAQSAAEAAGDAEALELLSWELGLLTLLLVPADGVSPYWGGDHASHAAQFRFTDGTAPYARERAAETQDVVLRLHYLNYVLLRMEPKGRDWISAQRELLGCYREYMDGCSHAASTDAEGFAGLYIDRALCAAGKFLSRPGVVSELEARDWAEGLVALAEESRGFPCGERCDPVQQRHRWVADYLQHLIALQPTASSPSLRQRALRLLEDAGRYYQATPLNNHFECLVANVDGELRQHWGETGTHERLLRRQFDAFLRRAQFDQGTGNGYLAAHHFREARRLIEQHRQYFTRDEVASLERAEHQALEHAVQGGNFKRISVRIPISVEIMDCTRETPEATVGALREMILASVPNRAAIAREARVMAAQTPLRALIGRTVIGSGKVVGETHGGDDNLALDVEWAATLQALPLGAAVAQTIVHAAEAVGLTSAHLVAPLGSLHLDDGTLSLLRHGLERLMQQDFVSALHILVPHVEDVLRQHLKEIGVDTTTFRADVGSSNSRTDDATFGSLMYKSLPDGRSVKEYLGEDLWDHLDSVLNSQTGLNLRNEFAHGLARPEQCSPQNAGLVLALLYLLASVASRVEGNPSGPE